MKWRLPTWARRESVVRQREAADCGPAALLTILRTHGGDASLVRIRELAATDTNGCTLLSLARAAERLGFEACGATGTYEELAGERLPCIAHVVLETGLHHFVVIHRMTPRHVVVGDPARGVERWTREQFLARWKEQAVLLLTPRTALLREDAPHWLRWLAAHFASDGGWLYQSLFLGTVYTVLGLITAVFVQLLIDRFIPANDLRKVLTIGAALVVLQIVRAAAGLLRMRFTVELNRRVGLSVGSEFLTRLFRLPTRFFETRKIGDITSRLRDSVSIQSAVIRVLGTTVIDALVLVGSLVTMFVMAPPLAWLALAVVPMYAVLLGAATRRFQSAQNDVMAAYGAVEAAYIDSIHGVEQVRAFNAGDTFARFTFRLYERLQRCAAMLGRIQGDWSFWTESVGGASLIASLVLGASLVGDGALTLGKMIGAYSLLAGVLPAVYRLIDANVTLQGAAAAAARLQDLLLATPERDPGGLRPPMGAGLGLTAASFTWPTGRPLLQDVTMEIAPGRITGLAGPSGAGKSTLVKLLERKYPLDDGQLTFGAVDAGEIELAAYRAQVVVVPESVHVFTASLFENIVLGREGFDVASTMRRLRELGLLPFFTRFEHGLATPVGETGRRLSSGERQVVGLARALLSRPQVLVVDEGLSAVDEELADVAHVVLTEYARERAVLVVSHDRRTLERTDYLYRLARGTIVESGPTSVMLGHARGFAAERAELALTY